MGKAFGASDGMDEFSDTNAGIVATWNSILRSKKRRDPTHS